MASRVAMSGMSGVPSQLGSNDQGDDGDGHGHDGGNTHQSDGAQNVGVHVGAQGGDNILGAFLGCIS